MFLTETLLTRITELTFNYALHQGQSIVEDWIHEGLDLEAKQQTFKNALNKAYEIFEKQYPSWIVELLNTNFHENEGVRFLAPFLIWDGYPDPGELATRWAISIKVYQHQQSAMLTWRLEIAATDFLGHLVEALKAEPELNDLNNSIFPEMNRTAIRCFLEHWCPIVEAALRPDLSLEKREIRSQQEIESIIGTVQNVPNVITLRLLAQLHRCGAVLPSKG